jgi:hypothetical protein
VVTEVPRILLETYDAMAITSETKRDTIDGRLLAITILFTGLEIYWDERLRTM